MLLGTHRSHIPSFIRFFVEDCCEGSQVGLEFISKEYVFIGMRPFGEAQSKAMRAYKGVETFP